MLNIISNGSKWAGESPDGIDKLFERLGSHPLDPRFEGYGNFIMSPLCHYTTERDEFGTPRYVDDLSRPIYPESQGAVRFFGNFYCLSAVFSIDTDEPELIERLTNAVRANQATDAYQQARKERGL